MKMFAILLPVCGDSSHPKKPGMSSGPTLHLQFVGIRPIANQESLGPCRIPSDSV
jgi:hypothetical protein